MDQHLSCLHNVFVLAQNGNCLQILHLILLCVVLGWGDVVVGLQFIVICLYIVPVISEDLVKGA